MLRLSYLTLILALLHAPLRAGSSNSLLDVSPDGKRLLAVNSDNDSVSVVDLTENKTVHEIPVGDKPEGATWIGDGPLAVITVYHEDKLVFIDAEKGEAVKELKVFDEPYGIVADQAGKRAWVTLDYPGQVCEIDLEKMEIARSFEVAPFIRGIALAPDEKSLYVTGFYNAELYQVDLSSDKVVDSWSGHSTDNLCRNVVIHPKRPKAYLPHIRSKVKVNHGSGSIFPHLTIYDLVKAEEGDDRRTSFSMDTFNSVYVTNNAWEAAISPDGKMFYLVFAGTNDMNICKVIDDDYREIEGIGLPMRVGQNPRAVRVSPDGERVYVYDTLDFAVRVIDPMRRRTLETIKVCDPPKTPEWVRGKALFNTALPPMTRRRWISCASCHPDGLSDGRTWKNPEGPRNTQAMMGMAHTHPLHWSADRDEVHDFEYTIRGQLMQGYGLLRDRIKPKDEFKPTELEELLAGRSKDLDALAIYTNSFEHTLSPHIPEAGKLSEEAQRGKALFMSKETGCATCHSGPYYSDSSLKKPFHMHDVGTGTDDDRMGSKYDTPSLLRVYRTAPYLHDGRAKTLEEVLTKHNQGDKHGRTSHLKPEEIKDLVAFLKALPYEMPPDKTPNTVKHRVVREILKEETKE